jgi:hypothetical protein
MMHGQNNINLFFWILNGPHISSRHVDRWHPVRGCYWQTPRRNCMTYERWINVHKWLAHYLFIFNVRCLMRHAEKTWWLSVSNLVTSVLICPSLQLFGYLFVRKVTVLFYKDKISWGLKATLRKTEISIRSKKGVISLSRQMSPVNTA